MIKLKNRINSEPGYQRVVFTFKYTDDFGQKSVEELSLSGRAWNVLKRNNILTLENLMDIWNNIGNLKSCGKTTVKEIRNSFLKYYYQRLSEQEKDEFIRKIKLY